MIGKLQKQLTGLKKKLQMDALDLEVLSVISEMTSRKVLENRYWSIVTDDRKTHGYYILKWYRPPQKLQEGTNIFKSVDVLWNDTYLNPTHQEHNWYTQITIKTVVCVKHFLTENIDLQKPSSFIKLTNTCNHWENIRKGATNLPDKLHKGLLDDITHRGVLDFIEHYKDGHQD